MAFGGTCRQGYPVIIRSSARSFVCRPTGAFLLGKVWHDYGVFCTGGCQLRLGNLGVYRKVILRLAFSLAGDYGIMGQLMYDRKGLLS